MDKTYLVQVEGEISREAVIRLSSGVDLKDGPTRPAVIKHLGAAPLADREPPIRQRANQPTSWISMTISEGRNRQVRRMTAAVGFPTLRLFRASIGPWEVGTLKPGQSRSIKVNLPRR